MAWLALYSRMMGTHGTEPPQLAHRAAERSRSTQLSTASVPAHPTPRPMAGEKDSSFKFGYFLFVLCALINPMAFAISTIKRGKIDKLRPIKYIYQFKVIIPKTLTTPGTNKTNAVNERQTKREMFIVLLENNPTLNTE